MPSIKAPATVLPGAVVDVDLDGFVAGERIRVLLDGASADSTVRARTDGSDRIARIAPTQLGTHSLKAQTRTPTWKDAASTSFQVQTVTPPPVPGPTAPVAVFGFSPTTGPAPFTVQFTDLSAGDITSWAWDFGAGFGTSTQRNPSFTFPAADSWDVKLTVTGPGGTDTQADVVVVTTGVPVPPPPDPDPDPIPGPLPTGKTVTAQPGDNIQALVNDATIDTLVLRDGLYTSGSVDLPARPSSKPLLVMAEHPHKVDLRTSWSFGGRGSTTKPCSYVTVTGLTWRDLPNVGDGAVFYVGYSSTNHCSLLDAWFINNHAPTVPVQNGPHDIYVSQGTHTDLLFEDIRIEGDGNRKGAGFHGYHSEGGADNRVTLRRFDISGKYCGILYWQPTSNMLVEDGIVHDCGQGYDFSGSVSGIIRRVQTVNAGGNKLGGMTQG